MNDVTTQSRAPGGAQIVGTPGRSEGPGPRLMLASTLEGNDVVNRAGEKLGTIEEIMLDVPMGRIAYAVLSTGGFLGVGDRLYAIPWGALTLDTDNKCFILDVSKERLDAARVQPVLELAEPLRESGDPAAPHRTRGRDLGADLRVRRCRARVDHHDVVPSLPAQADRMRERGERLVKIRGRKGGGVRLRRRRIGDHRLAKTA